ncbi:hypothetical protein [Paenibacillus assamensis]|uniref:hypothetical protein n=1 Tax=Paenibacillus assamensis TaxID=311244 RepID=UPI0012FC1F86|nr:hypothetical protein [Paenibacillus assamensis]
MQSVFIEPRLRLPLSAISRQLTRIMACRGANDVPLLVLEWSVGVGAYSNDCYGGYLGKIVPIRIVTVAIALNFAILVYLLA